MAHDMVLPPTRGLSLCSGGGGLDMGVQLAEPGFATSCYVEWEQEPRNRIIAAQQAGYFEPAPIWSDLTTFNARPWHGVVDTLLAGYPCQPFSQAGQRKGENDERHLWPDIARIIDELTPEDRDDPEGLRWIVLENVAGHVTLGAKTVLRDLWDLGFTPAAGLFSAEEVGAPHERLRWFCVAYRESSHGWGEQQTQGARGRRAGFTGGHRELADTDGGNASAERQFGGGQQRFQPEGGGTGSAGAMEDAGCSERRPIDAEGNEPNGQEAGRVQGTGGIAEPSNALEDAERTGTRGRSPRVSQRGRNALDRRSEGVRRNTGGERSEADFESRERMSGEGCEQLAHTREPGPQGRELGRSSREWDGAQASRSAAELCCPFLFPPAPSNADAWSAALNSAGHLAPAISLREVHAWARHSEALGVRWEGEAQSAVRRMADGMATRSHALKLLGNGVLPLVAGYAFRTLSAAHGLLPVDLEASGGADSTTDRHARLAGGD